MFVRKGAVVTSAVAALLVMPAVAPADEQVDEIIVKGRYLSIDKLNSVKTPTPVVDVPQSVSIIPSEQIAEQAFQDFGDVLRYTPGLSISQGEGHRDAINIRGIQSTADFFIDGIRDDVQYYRPLYNVEQIEILRGPNALLFGRGGGGGVINRVIKKPETGNTFAALNAGVDSFGASSINADANFDVAERVAVRVNGFYQELDNHRDFFGGNGFGINPTLKLELGPSTTAVFSYEYLEDDRVVDRGVPSRIVDDGPNVPLEGFRNTFFGAPEENFATLEADLVRARIDHSFSDRLRGNLTAQYADYDKLYQNLFPDAPVRVSGGAFPEVELDGYRDTTERQNVIVQGNLVGEFSTGIFDHTFLVGGEFGLQDTANARLDNVFATNGDDRITIPFTDPLDIPRFAFTALARDRQSEVTFSSVYLQDQIDLTDSLKLVLGLRYDEFDIEVLDIIEDTDGDGIAGRFSRVDQEVTPRLGFIYKPADNISLYASYGESFLPRSGDQFLTLDLNSESTRPQFFANREIGLKWDFERHLSLRFAAFQLERDSFTSIDPEDQSQLIVIEGSETNGFEAEVVGMLTDTWSVTGGYSYLDGEVQRADQSGNNGNKTRQTPENMFSLWNKFSLSDRLSLGLGVTYQDSYFIREDNSVEVPAFTRLDAGVFFRLNDSTSVQVNLENLLDEEYFPDAHSNNNITTGEPFNARLSLATTF